MRLLKQDRDGALVMKEFFESNIPAYVVLSHTWGAKNDEVTFTDFIGGIWRTKPGAAKLLFCAKQAARDGYLYFWIDSCCINKANHTELSEAINSMFRWYRDAKRCYVYLSDVPPPSENPLWQSAFDRSLWFTRGWTLQELLAPQDVVFFSTENGTEDSEILGCKDTLRDDIHDITGIPVEALQSNDFSEFSLHERMSWAERRNTTRPEDRAYCLIGILGISMGLRYGERDKEWERLTHKVNELSTNPQSARRLSSNSSPKVYMRRFIVITAIFALLVAWISNHFSLPIPSPLSSTPPPLPSSSAIFAIIGRTGAGKSTFIKALGARDSKGRYPQASDQLEPCTGDITFYKFSIHDTEAYIIDTPGFGDGNMSDTRVMMDIFDELNKLSLEGNKIRLIYLYDISLSKFDIEAHKVWSNPLA
ncbi:heterokaryon incompatibility protein-domain-containing protein [Cadophora sp. MPI-SDFR-AT-0126]|nr:heterokaryon incompatibility protein-domain-containing protein [Leotiomycetes sp. MPI-SDFR-AT-0126]